MTRIILTFGLIFLAATAKAQTLTFGIVPQQSAKKMAALWTPIFQYINQQSDLQIQFSTAKDIPTFEKRLLRGEYDIAYMNPYHYTVFSQKPGYKAIAKQKNKRIKGIMVVRKDSDIQQMAELNDKTLAFPSPAAFAASVLPQAKMNQDGISFKPQYVSSHDSVYLSVARGFFPAGGGVMRTFNNTSEDVRKQLKVMWTTPGYTSHAIAVHPRIGDELSNKIQQALLNLNDSKEGQRLLKSINFKGMEIANDKQWDDVRALDIKLLDRLLDNR